MASAHPSLLDAINSCSFIRMGNRIVYPGVNGNAFSFGDQPPVSAAHSMPDLSNIPEEEEEEDRASQDGGSSTNSSTQSLVVTPTPTVPEPAAVGLPPKLPPPPAALFPPPLPSKPATGIPLAPLSLSRRSSSSSRSSSPGMTRPSRATEQDKAEKEAQEDSDDTEVEDNAMPSPTIYRSSGTLTLNSPPTRKSSTHSPARVKGDIESTNVKTSLVMAPAAVMSATVSTPRAVKRRSNQRDQKRERAGSDGCFSEGGEPGRPATPDSGIDCQLDARGYEIAPLGGVKPLPRGSQEEASKSGKKISDTNNKIIPPEISSLRKGTMGVADLVTGVLINYTGKGKSGKQSSKTHSPKSSKKIESNGPIVEVRQHSPAPILTLPSTETTTDSTTTQEIETRKTARAAEAAKASATNTTAAEAATGTEFEKSSSAEEQPFVAIGALSNSMFRSWHGNIVIAQNSNCLDDNISTTTTTSTENDFNVFKPVPYRLLQVPQVDASTSDVSETESEASSLGGYATQDEQLLRKGKAKEKKKARDKNEKKTVKAVKKANLNKPKLEKAPQCRKCSRQFGLRCVRHHCTRCRKSYCDQCLRIGIYDITNEDREQTFLTRVCTACTQELAMENSRGQTRGLWNEYKQMRAEARDSKGLDVTSKADTSNREQTIHGLTPLVRKVCVTFLVEIQQQLDKAKSRSSVAYKVWEGTGPKYSKVQKAKMKEVKDCTACKRQLRYLTDSRLCDVCGETFCTMCTAKTLQLYLPVGTDLSKILTVDMIKFHIKQDEKDEILAIEASETYYTCLECENAIERFMKILSFNQNIPDMEAEMFDLQRHIDHALTYAPPHMMGGLRRSVSTNNLSRLDSEAEDTNMKLAHRLYDRFTRAYDVLNHMEPQTSGQKLLHIHIKQAMYDFYLKRRDQLKATLRRRGSCIQLTEAPL